MTTYQETKPCPEKWCKNGWLTATKDAVPTLCSTCDNHTGTITTDLTLEEIVKDRRDDVLKILDGCENLGWMLRRSTGREVKMKWISVKNRLPEIAGKYSVKGDNSPPDMPFEGEANYDPDSQYGWDQDWSFITHWSHYTEAPHEQKGE